MVPKFELLNKGVKLSCDGNQMRKKEKRWTHLTIKLYLGHSLRSDRPKIQLFAALKWFQKSFYYYHCSISCISALELPARKRSRTARNTVKKLGFFVAFPVNIFRPRKFEGTSKLLSTNMIWTFESSEIFLSQSERNYELRKLKNGTQFQKLFSVLDWISAALPISVMFLLYSEH